MLIVGLFDMVWQCIPVLGRHMAKSSVHSSFFLLDGISRCNVVDYDCLVYLMFFFILSLFPRYVGPISCSVLWTTVGCLK